MINRCTEWMSGRWWAALAVLLAFILVARTGTVGAPAEARTEPIGGQALFVAGAGMSDPGAPNDTTADQARELAADAAAERIRELEHELALAVQTLRFERERAELLRVSRDQLDGELARLGARVRETLELANDPITGAPVPAGLGSGVPAPIEALFLRERAR